MVAEGDCVSVGRGGGVDGEQDTRKRKEERRMRAAMILDMSSILTESDYPLINDKPSRDVSMREG